MRLLRLLALLAACLGYAVFSAPGQTWDARTGFSATLNPNGVWSYGWSTTLAGPLTVFPDHEVTEGAYNWVDDSIIENDAPNISDNTLDTTVGVLPAHQIAMHPGPGNQFTHCRWTAAASGTYNVWASFTARDTGGPHGYILENGRTIGDNLLTENIEQDYTFDTLVLEAGDTIEAAVGVGADGVYYNDSTQFSLTITAVATGSQSGEPAVAGGYMGLFNPVDGPGLAGGTISARVTKSGAFTATLNWGGMRVALKGSFKGSGKYASAVTLADGKQVTVSLAFDANGNLTGSVNENGTIYELASGGVTDKGPAAGYYPFAINATPPGDGVPEGSGFGYMYVRANGAVSLSGMLADGMRFAASLRITSGTSVAIYANPYKTAGSGISGSVYFADVPGVSDCAGTLYWSLAPGKAGLPYSQGFNTPANFVGAAANAVIGGLNQDSVSFDASGADLQADFVTNVTLHTKGNGLGLTDGKTAALSLSILPVNDYFFGTFTDSTTNKRSLFGGVLLPKSRTGEGFFISQGLSGAVDIQY